MSGENDTIILFTTTYPYSTVSESFLDPEIPHLAEEFKRVILVPRYCPEDVEQTERRLPPNVVVDRSYVERYGRVRIEMGSALRCLGSSHLYKEVINRPSALRLRFLKRLMFQLSEALQVRDWVIDFLKRETPDLSKTVFYSYWLDACPLGVGFAKEKHPGIKIVSRAHRGDLYEEIRDPPYLPHRKLTIQYLDRLYLVSEDGKRYVTQHFPQFTEKYFVSRLGVPHPGFMTSNSDDDVFRIVSCSYMIPVKRIDLLIMGLKEAGLSRSDKRFEWRHVGYGPLQNSLKDLASTILPPNVVHRFLGHLTKEEVINQYRENVDVFINVSSSEGIPVSIMEAQSLGIPVIATAVGGTPEIVSDENGLLLKADPTPQDIAEALFTFLDDQDLALDKRKNSKENWLRNYNSNIVHARLAQMMRWI